MSVCGLRGSILMQLALRGGHRIGRRIRPGEVDGYMQAIRDSTLQNEVSKRTPPSSEGQKPPIAKGENL